MTALGGIIVAEQLSKDERDSLTRNYVGFSNLIRAWLSTYGVGFIVVIISQDNIVSSLIKYPQQAKCSLTFIFAGLMVQVGAALVYKYVICYLSTDEYCDVDNSQSKSNKFCDFVYKSIKIELAVDAFSLFFYGIGTFKLINILLP